MSELTSFEKVNDDIYIYEKITTTEEQISIKHLKAEKDRLYKRITEIDLILEEVKKVK